MSTNTQIIGASSAFSLDELNQWIAENEQLLGPIVEIADGGTQTAGEFDLIKPRVKSKFAKVALAVGSQCVAVPGFTQIDSGQAYISGALMDVCLMRPN